MPSSWERTQIVRQPPLLCLEVKSPAYSLKREISRAQDYLRMGVAEVWIFDPETRTAYVLRGEDVIEHREGVLKLAGTAITLDLASLFRVLDE
jgi:Uma2 family endonuclease